MKIPSEMLRYNRRIFGMRYYRCDHCAVITNSQFTTHAQEAARESACKLIDGSHIPDLIRGREFPPTTSQAKEGHATG